jgi:hypothetical protein
MYLCLRGRVILPLVKGILQNLYALQALDLRGATKNVSEVAVLRAAIPEGMLTNYDRARARGRKGIAVVRNHVCTNCRMQVPVAVTASLTAGTIQVCGNCGLYLCLPPADEPAAPVAAASAPAIKRTKKPRPRALQGALSTPNKP